MDSGTPVDGRRRPAGATPSVVAVSATGHDRFFGVTYDAAGSFYAVGVVSDSNVAATADFETVVAKFSAAGVLDTSFGTGGYARHNLAVGLGGEVARGIVVQSTGKIVVAATIEHVGAMDPRDRDIALVRFNANGTRDTAFGTNGVVTLDLSDGVLDGHHLRRRHGLGAHRLPRRPPRGHRRPKRTGGTDTDFAVVRLSADGVRDAAFGTNGVATVDINNRSANPRTATLLPDGSIVVSGYMDDGGVVKPVLFKLTPRGRSTPPSARRGSSRRRCSRR